MKTQDIENTSEKLPEDEARLAAEEELRKVLSEKKKRRFPWKPIIIVAVIIVIAAAAFFIVRRRFTAQIQSNLTDYTVARGEISVSISGTAAVEPREQYTIQSLVTGEILEDFLEEGQQVSADQLLYKIDTKNVDSNIRRGEITLERQQISYDKTLDGIGSMSVVAPSNGLVTQVYVKEGDTVQNKAKIADIVDNTRMSLVVPFLSDDAANIRKGAAAQVTITDSGVEIDGTVERVYTGRRTGPDGATVTDVEIVLSNPGGLSDGEIATAIVGGEYACNSEGEMKYADEYTITADGSGDLYGFGLKVGDEVNKGQTVARLTNDSTSVDIRSAELSLQDAEISLQNLLDTLEDYNIKSPISGTVIEKTAKLGDKLDSANARANMAVIADMSELVFTLNVDELDITKLAVGQKAVVTADALEDMEFEAVVESISIIGTTNNGVTNYPVKLAIKEYEGLWPGMNINAEIVFDEVSDVLVIPAGAVSRGNMVLRKITGTAAASTPEPVRENPEPAGREPRQQGQRMMGMMEAPEGYEYVRVTLGLANSDLVEVTSGLEEGDIIGYTVAVSNTNMFGFAGGGGMGGMGGNVTVAGGGPPQQGGEARRVEMR